MLDRDSVGRNREPTAEVLGVLGRFDRDMIGESKPEVCLPDDRQGADMGLPRDGQPFCAGVGQPGLVGGRVSYAVNADQQRWEGRRVTRRAAAYAAASGS